MHWRRCQHQVCDPTTSSYKRGNVAQRGSWPSQSHSALGQAWNPGVPLTALCPAPRHPHVSCPSLTLQWHVGTTRKPSQWSRCKYFPFGLQVSKIPFLPCSFRQFMLPFSKQISTLIKAFITIIHLSLQGIRQLQSTNWLSHHAPSPVLLAGGGAHINRTFH